MRSLIFLCALSLFGCAHRPAPQWQDSLFKKNNYKHSVSVHIQKTNQTYHFTGVVGLNDTSLKIYMMGPMNVSAVKITETFSNNKVEIENYFDQLKPHESKIARFYEILRSFILFPKNSTRWGQLNVSKKSNDGQILSFSAPHGIEIQIISYKNETPQKILFKHPEFSATIEEIP